jgi:hypothetical protein
VPFCPAILEEPHRRAGEVCGRRYMAGEGCENHRPKKVLPSKPAGKTAAARQRRRNLAKRAAGLPDGWGLE